MDQLHLVFFTDCQRYRLLDPLGRRAPAKLGLLDLALAKLQLRFAPDQSSLQGTVGLPLRV